LTTFSPTGKLTQIDHALTAVGNGLTALGIKATNGVVIATKKASVSVLADETSLEKIALASNNIGMTYAGLGPDFRVLTAKGRKEVQKYWLQYHDQIPVSQFVQRSAGIAQEFTQSGGVRPFGVSLLVAGYDDDGPQLYQVDPSGSFWAWKASAIGAKAKGARSFLEKRYDAEMEIEDAIHTAILALKEDFEGEVTAHNIEVGVIRTDRQFKVLTPAEVADYIAEAA
jgi:20S proteasome subunit alpha 2